MSLGCLMADPTDDPVKPYAVPLPGTALCQFCGLGIRFQEAKANPKFRLWRHVATDKIDCSTVKQE